MHDSNDDQQVQNHYEKRNKTNNNRKEHHIRGGIVWFTAGGVEEFWEAEFSSFHLWWLSDQTPVYITCWTLWHTFKVLVSSQMLPLLYCLHGDLMTTTYQLRKTVCIYKDTHLCKQISWAIQYLFNHSYCKLLKTIKQEIETRTRPLMNNDPVLDDPHLCQHAESDRYNSSKMWTLLKVHLFVM